MSFGSRLRERREALGLKQGQLGKMLGITGSAIGNYENGVSSPKADVLYRVFDVLKCDANFLFQDEMQEGDIKDTDKTERILIDLFRQLNDEGQYKLTEYASDLLSTGKYKKRDSFGMVQKP